MPQFDTPFLRADLDAVSNELTVTVMGDIGYDFRADYLIEMLRYFRDEAETVLFEIFSYGGMAFDALAVYDYIKTNGIQAEARVYGIAGSAATVIACSANKVGIGENSFYMVHNAYNSATGQPDRVSEMVSERLVEIYQKKTGKDKRTIKKLMSDGDNGDTILSAREAKDLGFADEILKEKASVAALMVNRIVRGTGAASIDNSQTQTSMEFNLVNFVKNFFKVDVKDEKEAKEYLAKQDPADFGTAGEEVLARIKALEEKAPAADVDLSGYATKEDLNPITQAVSGLTQQVTTLVEKLEGMAEANAAMEEQKEEKEDALAQEIKALEQRLANLQMKRSGATGQQTPPAAATANSGQGNKNVVFASDVTGVLGRLGIKTNAQ